MREGCCEERKEGRGEKAVSTPRGGKKGDAAAAAAAAAVAAAAAAAADSRLIADINRSCI